MSVASADEAMNTSDVPDPPTTGLQLQQQPIEKIHHPENSHSFDEGECARAVGQGGHEEGGFAGIITGNSAVSSLNATAASTNVATIAVDSTAGAQKNGNGQLTPENESANVVASSGELAVSPSQPPPPPPSYALALGMSRSPRGYGTSTITKAGPSADKADVVHVSPSQPPHHVPSASSRGATKTTTTISPIGAGAANSAGAGGSGAPGASENVLLGSPPPPPYEVILSPVADKASMVEHVEVLGGDSAALSMTPAGLDHITASVPPTVSAALHPTDPVEGEFSRMFFGAFKSLGVPTTGVATRDWGGEKEKTEVKEKEKVREKKKDIGGSAVSRLRQIFERNNFDSKKRASLEARPLSRPIAAVTAPSIGEHEVTEKIVAAVPQASVDAAGASAALDTDASVPAVGPIAVGTSPVVAFDNTVGTGLAPTSGPPKQAPSSAAEQSDGAMAAVRAVAQDHPSVLAQSALLSVADTRSTSGTSRPLILPERMGESSSAQTASFAKASGVPIISSPADVLVGEEQAPCEEEHVPTEGEVSMPTEEAASTKVAVKKTSTFRFSLQEMFFESSKDAASPKASGLAGGGPAPAVYQRENESPGTGTGLTGSTRGQDADEVRLTTASIADDNFAAAVDEAQMVGVVSPPGVMTNPSMLYAFSAPTTGIEQASIATVEGEIHEDAASVESETDVPMTEGRSGDWVHVVESPVSTTVTGEATMPELVQELADTGSNAAVSAPVDVGVVEIADAVDGGTTEEDNEDGTEVKMAGGMPVATTEASVPDVVSRAMEAVTDELSPTAAPVSSEIVEDSSLPLYMGSNTFLHGLSSSTSVADQMSGSDQVEVPGAPAAEVEQAAGDEESVTLDIHAAAGLVIPEEKTETEQRVAAGEALVAEEGAVVSAAATDDEFDGGKAVPVSMQSADVDGEQTAEELGRDEMALAKVDSASPAGTGTAIPSDSAGEMEPVATQLSSLVADKVPEVQAAAWNVEDSANAMTAGTTDSFIKQPVPVTEAVVEGDGMLPSAVEGNDDEVEDELNVVDAFSSGGVEELREMFDQKVSRADTADGDMAGIALDTTIFQTKEGEVVHQTVSASEELATALTAVGDTPGAAMPPTPADGAGEDGQTCALEGAEDAPDSGDFAVFDAVLDLSAVENQPAEPEEAHVGPIAKVYDVIGEVAASVAASVKPETVPLAEAGKEDDAQLSRTWETMQVAVQECAPEVSQGFLATGPDGAPPSYVDVVGANTVGHTIDGGTPEKDREDGKEVGIAGGGPVTATVAVPGPVCDAIETTPDQRAPITAPSPGAGIEGSTPLLSLGSITLVPDLSSSASMADHMSDGNPGEISGEAAPDVDQAARNDLSVTPDNVLAEVDPVMLGADVEPEQRVSTRDGLVAEEGAVVSAAAADDDSAADKAIPVSPESAGVEIELGTALEVVGTVSLIADEGAGVTEGAGGAEPVTIQHSPSAVDQVPEVEAAGSVVEDPSVNAATDDLPIEQLIQSVVADDPVDDTGTEAGVDEPVPLIEASAEGDVVLTAVVEKIDDVVDEEPNVAGADPPSRVEELRQTFDQKTSRADEETLDGDVADVAEGNGGLQAEEGKGGVGPDAAVAVKELPAFPAAGGGNPVVAMLFPTAEDPREEDQSDVVVEDERASGGGDAAFAAAVLDKADPSVVADQLSGTATPHQAPVATVEDVIEVDPTSVRPEYVPMTDVGVKVGTQRGEPSCAVPVPVQDTAVEVSQVVETARPGEALMAPVDGRTMKRKKGDGEVDMDSAPESAVATVAVIPDAVTDAIEAVIDEPSLVDTPMSGVGVEGGTSSLSTDVVSAGDEGSAILDGAHADAAPVALGAEAALEQPVSASMDSMEVDGTDAPVAATDGVSGASEASPVFTESTSGEVEQTVEEAVSDDTATTEDDIKSPAGADTAGPSEGAGSVEHLAPPLSSLVVDQVPEVEAAVMEVEDSSANEATDDLPIEQLIERAVPDDPVDDTGPEAGGDEHVPLTEALVEGVVVLVAVEEIEDVVNEGPNVAGADPPSRVEELRQMLDQKASRADEETPDGEVADVADNNAGLQAEEGNVRVGQEAAFAAEELSDTPAAGGANPVVAMPLRTIEGSREDDQVDAVEEGGSASVCGGTAVAAAVLEKVEPSAVAEQLLDDDGAGAPVAAKNGVSSASDASPAFTDPASGKVEQTAEETVSDDAAPAEEDIASPAGIDAAGPSEGAGSAEPLTSRLSSLVEDQVPEVEAAVMEVEDSSANESTEDSPIEQPIQSAVADDAVDDTGPEAGADEPVPLTEASVGGDVVLAAAMKKIDDKVDEEPNVAGADPPSRVEELRQMLDQKASRADEETPDGEVADVPEDDGELQVGEGNVCSEAAFAAEELSDTHATGGVNPVVAIPVPTNEGSRENEQSNAVEEGGSAFGGGNAAVAAAVLDKVEPSAVAEQLLDDDGACAPVAATDGVSSASDPSPASTDPTCGKVEQAVEEVVSHAAAPAEQDVASPAGTDAAGPSEGAGSVEHLATPLSSLVVDRVPEVEAAVMEVEDSSANECTEDSPIEQLIESVVPDDPVDDTGPEAGADEPVPLTEAPVEGDVVVAAAMEKIDDEVDEGPNVAGADPPSRVEELRQMLDQKASRADEETPDGEVADVPVEIGGLQAEKGNVRVGQEAAFAAEELPTLPPAGGANPVVAMPPPTTEGSREDEQSNAVEEGGSAFGGGDAAVAAAVLDKVEPSAVAEQLLEEDRAGAPVAATDGVSSASDPSPAFTDPTCGKVEQAAEEVVSHVAAPTEQHVASPAGTDTARPSEGAGSVEHLAPPLSSLVVDQVPEVEAAVMEVEDSSANECTEDSPIEQPVKSAVADDAVDESVPRTKASVEGDVVVAAAVKIYVVVDEEPNVAGAAVSSRVEELRQMLDQKASRADEETSDGEVSDVAENNAGLQAEEGNVVEEAAFAAEELPTLPAAGEDNPVVAVPLHTTEGSREDEQVDAVEEADSASVSGNAAVAAAVLDKAEPSAVAEQLLDDDGTGAPAAATDGVSSVRNANPGFTDPASGEVEQAVEEVVSDDAAPTEQYVASPASTDAAGPSEGAGSAERLATPLSSLVVDQVPEVEGAVEVEDSSANEATDDSPIEQLIESVVPDDAVDDTGPEAGADEPVPLTEASVERDVILAAVVKKIDDVVDEEPNVAGADPPSRVEELRQMLDQKASHADEEAAYGEVSDVAENNARLQAEEGNVVEEAAFAAEELPTLPAAGGVNPVVAVPLHTTEGQREDEQVDAVEEADSASVSGNAAVAAAVLENAEPSAIAHQLSGTPMPYQAPVATVGELMEVDPTSVRPEGISMTDARAEEATQTAESSCAVPELTKDSAAEVLQDLATERPGGSPPAPVCWRTTEQKLAEGGVNMAGATKSALATSVAVVPGAVTDAIEAVIDQPALVHTLVPGVDVKDCTLSLPAGFASAGDEVTATLDGAQAEAEPVALGAEAALEQPVSAGMGCMEEDGAGALAAATDEVSGANNTSPVFTESMTGEVEQTAEEVESNVAAPAEEDVASLAGTEATGPSEGAGSVGPLAPPLSSLVVDQSTEDSPIEQLVESAVADDAVDDTGPEAGADEPVPLTEASVEGDVVLAAAMEKIDDVVDEEPNVAGADPSRRVEELRQMFDQKASRADEETAYGDVADVPEDKSGLQVKEGNVGVGQEAAFAAEELPTLPAAGGANPMVAMPLPTTEGQRENEQVDAVEEEERASAGGDATVAAAVLVKAESSAVTEQLLEEDGACLPAAATNGVSSANNASPLFTYPTCGKVKQTAEETVSDDAAPTKGDMASPSGTDTAVLSQGAGGVEPRATPLLSLVVDQVPDEGAVTAVESSPPNEATDLPIEQLIQSVVADDLLDDTGPEAGADEPVPLTEASVEGDVVLAAAMEEIDDEVDEEPNVAGADPSRRVEELRQMFDQKASRADEEIPYGDVADVPEDNGELQAEERNVVKVSAFAAEELPTLPAAGGDNPMVAMPLPTAEALAEDKQSDAVEEEESTSGGGDAVVAAVVMDKAEPSAVTDQLSGTATPYQAPVAMMEDAIEVDPTSVRPGGVSLTDARAEEGTHGTATSCTVPVPVQDGAAEVSQDVTTVRPGGSPLAPVDGRTTEQNTAGGQVKMAGAPESAVSTVAVGPNAVSDAIEAMIDELALVDKPISGVGVEGSTSSLSAGVTSAGDEVSAASDGAHDGESGASEAMPMLTESAGADADQTAEVSDETVPVKVYRASSADDRTTCSSEGTPEVSQEIEGLDQALGGDGTEQHDKEVDVAGGGGVAATVAAVHEPVSDTIEHMSDQLPPTSKPVSGAGTGSHNSLLSVVPAIPVPGFSSSPSMADQMSDREQVEAAGAATAASAVEHASEDEPSDTLDEVDAEVKPVSLGGETEPDQPVSTSEALGEEDDAVASAAAVDGASGACEVTVVSTGLTGVETGQTVGALASDDAAPAEAPIAAVEDTIEDGFLSIRPEAVSVSEVCSDEGAQTADPSVAVPVPVQETTRDEPPELAFTGSGGEPTTPADAADTNTFDGAVDGERAELGKDDEEDVKMAGTGLVDAVPDVVSSAIEAGTDQLAPPAAPGLGEGGDDSTSTVLVDSSTLVHGMSADATVVDQMSDGEPDKVEGVTTAAEIEQAAGDEMPVTLESLPAEVVIVRETGSEQPISASEALVEDSAVAPAVAADGESGAPARIAQAGGEAAQTVGERVSGFTTASRVPIATAGDVIEDDAEPATRGTSFAIDIRSEDWIEVVGPSITVPAPEQSTAPEAPQALAAISPHGELSLPVDVVADNFDGVVDADRAEQDKEDGEGVEMASEGSVNAVSDAVPDAIEAVTGRLAPTPALSSSEGVQDNSLPLSDGPSTLAHGMSSDATVIDQISHGEPVETARVAAVGNQTAGDGLSVTADNVHAEIKPVTPDEDTEPERRVSASGALVEEESAVIPAAAPGADGESSEGAVVPISTYSAGAEANRMLEEPIGGITALAEAFITSPKGAKTAGLKSGEILLSTVAVNEPPQVELGAVILGDAEVIADTAGSPIDQLGESAVGDAPVNSDQGTVLEQPLQAAEAVGEGGMVDATEDVNAADRIPTCPESAGAKAEESKLAVVNEIVSGGTAPVVADALPAGDNSDNDGSVESAEIVELRDDQPVTGDARTNAGQEAEVLVGSGVLVSPAAPGAEEESCVGDAALTPTESAGVQVEQEEAETAVELVSGGTAPVMLDAEALAPVPGDSRTPAIGGLVSSDLAGEGTPLQGNGQSFEGKKRHNPFGFLPKLLGWDKKDNRRSRVARGESATQAALGHGTAARPLVSTAAGDFEDKEATTQGGKSAVDGQASSSADSAVMTSEPLEEIMVPAPTAGGIVSDRMENKRLSHEAGNRYDVGGLATTAPAPQGLEEPTSTKKNQDGGFSLPKLFGWVKQDTMSSRAVSFEAATPQVTGEISPEETENPIVDDEFSIVPAMMSAGGVSDPIEDVSDSIHNAADERLRDDEGDTELATTQEPVFAEVERTTAASLEAPVLSPDTISDVYKLKVQVGAEHAFPVVASDVPVAEVSPLAHHFAEFDQEERIPSTAGASTLAVADEVPARMDEEAETDATSEPLSMLSPVAAAPKVIRPGETFKLSATGNSNLDNVAAVADLPPLGVAEELAARMQKEGQTDATIERLSVVSPVAAGTKAMRPEENFKPSATGNSTLNNDPAEADLPPSGVEETAASARVNVCGITKTGMADSTATFGVVDFSALMAEETAEKACPNLEPQAPTVVRGPQRSLSPGWKGYVDADASPETAGVAGGVDQAGVSLQSSPGDAEGRAEAGDPYASSAPGTPTLNVCSPHENECAIS